MIQDITFQLCAIGFSIALAKHNAPAVLHFEEYGFRSSAEMNKAMAQFHRYNVWVKIIFCILVAVDRGPDQLPIESHHWVNMVFAGLTSAFWIWLIFDIALNLNRPGRKWYYLGLNDADGRRWIKRLGEKAGKIKAAILLAVIILLNVAKALFFNH